jgi:hypothetical protein
MRSIRLYSEKNTIIYAFIRFRFDFVAITTQHRVQHVAPESARNLVFKGTFQCQVR